ADADVIELGYRFLVDLGVPDVVVQLNSLGDPGERPAYVAELRSWLEARIDQLCADSRETLAVNPMRVLDCKTCAPLLVDAPTPRDRLGADAAAAYEVVKARLDAVGVPWEDDPRLVRGLDYYTRTAFEYVGGSLDIAQVALGGGGRYDGLAEEIGGRRVPGVGLAMGVDRIILALGDETPPAALDAFVVTAGERAAESARLLSELRRQGLRVDATDPGRSVKAQFKAADRSGAPVTLVVGDEWDAGIVRARRMTDGTESDIDRLEVATWLRS
ncbi:MAG: His/Gly/Thr/Pro-type tRNA ligase C-terminal domain-containing protein, partial [Acidimicrobiia bacterium]